MQEAVKEKATRFAEYNMDNIQELSNYMLLNYDIRI